MQDLSYSLLRKAVSDERFESYRQLADDSDVQLLDCYLWNIQLSEAFYPILSFLEITLRNQLNYGLSQLLKTTVWYDEHIAGTIFSAAENQEIQKAKVYLQKRGKQSDVGRLIAELNFGFWTSLFHPYYEKKLWPALISEVFPNAPRWTRERKKLLKRLNSFRLLRNRISHYEPIWHWDNLPNLHQELIETIGWLSVPAQQAVLAIDRFESVRLRNTSLSIVIDE